MMITTIFYWFVLIFAWIFFPTGIYLALGLDAEYQYPSQEIAAFYGMFHAACLTYVTYCCFFLLRGRKDDESNSGE